MEKASADSRGLTTFYQILLKGLISGKNVLFVNFVEIRMDTSCVTFFHDRHLIFTQNFPLNNFLLHTKAQKRHGFGATVNFSMPS